MSRVLASCLALSMAGLAFSAEAPVTRREFSIIAAEVESAINRGLSLSLPVRTVVADKSPMPRSELIFEFAKIFESVKPSFTMTPRPFRFDQEMIKKHNKEESAGYLSKLCRWGMVSPAGPMVIGPDEGLTPRQVGDALGSFVLQISVLTHQPTPLWSPGLMKGG